MSGKSPAKPPPKRRLADCVPGDIAETPAGHLLVTGDIGGRPLVRLWHPAEQRELTHPFSAPSDLVLVGVTRKPTRRPAAAGDEVDPLRGMEES